MAHGVCPSANEGCPLYDTKLGCHTDQHHLMWPARFYKSELAEEYRELPEHKVQICRAQHDEIHATKEPPERLSPDEMRQAIARSALRGLGETA